MKKWKVVSFMIVILTICSFNLGCISGLPNVTLYPGEYQGRVTFAKYHTGEGIGHVDLTILLDGGNKVRTWWDGENCWLLRRGDRVYIKVTRGELVDLRREEE